MIKNYFDKAPRKEFSRRDINQRTSVPIEGKAQEKEMSVRMQSQSRNDMKEAVVFSDKDFQSTTKESNHLILNVQEKLIRAKAQYEQSQAEAMQFLESIETSLNEFSQRQGQFNLPLPLLENTEQTVIKTELTESAKVNNEVNEVKSTNQGEDNEMTAVSNEVIEVDIEMKGKNTEKAGLNKEITGVNTDMTGVTCMEDVEDADEENEEEETPKHPPYAKISNNLIKKNNLYYIEITVFNRKHLVGPYIRLLSVPIARKRFEERSKYLPPSAFLKELKYVKNYLSKTNGYQKW